MDIKFVGERPREVAPAYYPPFVVEPGQVVKDLPDELAESLLEQSGLWERAAKPKTKEDK